MTYELNEPNTAFSAPMLENSQSIGQDAIDLSVKYFIDQEKQIEIQQKRIIKIKHLGLFSCHSCAKITKKLFEGFCFPCFKYKACADRCIMSPHLCHYINGTCREPTWGEQFCYQPHYVYLSFTDKFKVGITRETQIPTRWIDQGATSAILLAKVTSRNQAGILEHKLKEVIHDKSHWLNMLKNGNNRPTLSEIKNIHTKIYTWIKEENILSDEKFKAKVPGHINIKTNITLFESPVAVNLVYPFPLETNKYKSINLEKINEFEEEILGIKGQYLIFNSLVFNMRKHEGFITDLEIK